MAFRTQKRVVVVLGLLAAAASAAGPVAFSARHRHVRKGGIGELRIADSSLSFQEAGKKKEHAWEWKYEDIQQLFLGAESLRIRTYDDVAWKLGRDREFQFDRLPKDAALTAYPALASRIDRRRFVVAIADPAIEPLWQIKAKHRTGFGGSEGIVLVGRDAIVYRSEEKDASRSWRMDEIDNISSAGPFDLSITTFELDGPGHPDRREFRFQLKEALTESRYESLWLRLNRPRIQSKEKHE